MDNKTIQFKNKIQIITNCEYELIGEYINITTKVLMRHNCNECNNHEWEVSPKKFIYDKTRCPICSRKSKRKGTVVELSEEIKDSIIQLYSEKNSIKSIAKQLKISAKKISNTLKENNINIDGKLLYQKYTDEFILKIAEQYIPGENMYELSKIYNIEPTTLMYRFKQLGIKTTKRKHKLNEKYFEVIDTQNKAYLLGFLMADGCVTKTDETQLSANRLIISISKKDRSLLEFMVKEIECDYEIVDFIPSGSYANHEMSRLSINSKTMCTDLAKYGIMERKTGKEIFPILDKEMQRHFIRGFLDGDGYITNKGKTIGFCSTEEMLSDILSIVKTEFDIESVATIRKDSRDKPLYYMEFSCANDIKNLKDYLYKDANFCLERKYSKLT